jgi:hypothetical protein
MSTAYTLPTQDILIDALEIMGVIGAGQTASPEDFSVVMRSLQNILKELPIHGLVWPKVTAPPVLLPWSALTPGVVAMPVDYFGSPSITRTVRPQDGHGNPPVWVVTKAEYDRLNYEYIDPVANPSLEPQRIYIAPNNIGYLWPIPSVDPLLRMTYQAVTNDAVLNMTPDVSQTWTAGLGLWVAYEASPKFGVDMATRADIQARFMMRRALMLQFAAETAPITMGVWD